MEGRLGNVIETVLASGIVVGIAALLALIVRLIFKRQIGSSSYYAGAMVLGAVLYRGLLAALTHTTQIDDSHGAPESLNAPTILSLDSPFIAPQEAQLEAFPVQLEGAFQRLAPNDKAALAEALQFISFATASYLATDNPAAFAKLSENDLAAKNLSKLYRFTRDQGSSMTLRKYIELADTFKKAQPGLWDEFKAANKVSTPRATGINADGVAH